MVKKRYEELYGKQVSMYDGENLVFENRTLYFAGTNRVGHEVIVTEQREMYYIHNWTKINLKLWKS